MTHDANFEQFPWKEFEYFPREISGFPPSSSYTNPEQNTKFYSERAAPATTPIYGPYMQQSWALAGNSSSGSGTAKHPNGAEPRCTRGKAYVTEAENLANSSMLNHEGAKAEGHQHVRTSPPVRHVGQPSKGKRFHGGQAGNSPPRSRRAAAKAKSRFIGQATCGWSGCTSQRLYSYDTSLWRHIKEKHLHPDSFKCPAPDCEKSYGRNDKLAEHWQSAHSDGDSPKDSHCHSYRAEFHAAGWS